MDLNKIFVSKGIYKLKNMDDSVFVCEGVAENALGKLNRYEKCEDKWIRTGNSYFLNNWATNDLKELFCNRQNYDMIGILDENYKLDKQELRKL